MTADQSNKRMLESELKFAKARFREYGAERGCLQVIPIGRGKMRLKGSVVIWQKLVGQERRGRNVVVVRQRKLCRREKNLIG